MWKAGGFERLFSLGHTTQSPRLSSLLKAVLRGNRIYFDSSNDQFTIFSAKGKELSRLACERGKGGLISPYAGFREKRPWKINQRSYEAAITGKRKAHFRWEARKGRPIPLTAKSKKWILCTIVASFLRLWYAETAKNRKIKIILKISLQKREKEESQRNDRLHRKRSYRIFRTIQNSSGQVPLCRRRKRYWL